MRKTYSLPFFFFLFIIGFVFYFSSCRKPDIVQSPDIKPLSKAERFFTVPAASSPQAKAIAQAIKIQDEKFHFVFEVIKKAGYPIWDKVRIISSVNGSSIGKSSSDSGIGEIVYIPFALDSQRRTNAVLSVQLNDPDTTYRMLYASNYRLFGYDTTNQNKWSARNVFQLFSTFDYTVFGHTKFLVKDDSLFVPLVDSMNLIATLVNYQGQNIAGRNSSLSISCADYTVCLGPSGGGNNGDGSSGGGMAKTSSGNCFDFTVCTVSGTGGSGTSPSGGGSTGGGSNSGAPSSGWNGSGTGSGSPSSGPSGSGSSGGGDGWWSGGPAPCSGNIVQRTTTFAPGDGCAPGWIPIENPSVFLPSIQVDPSITNNPIIKCVYDNLMNPDLKYGLKNILKAFDQNYIYNIKFQIGQVNGDGVTNYLQNNTWLTTINKDRAEDAGYSRIWLASTFIHEAFHAKLRQHAIAVLGTDEIQNWPKPIDDMTLSELATYYEASSKAKNIWNNIGHDWMVNNIDELAISLREFVKKFYQTTYALPSLGDNLDGYRALAYMGLAGSQFYQEKVIDAGLQSQFNAYRSALNEGGTCSN